MIKQQKIWREKYLRSRSRVQGEQASDSTIRSAATSTIKDAKEHDNIATGISKPVQRSLARDAQSLENLRQNRAVEDRQGMENRVKPQDDAKLGVDKKSR